MALVMIDLDNTLADRGAAVSKWIEEFCSARALPPDAAAWIMTQDEDGYSDRHTVFESIRTEFGLDTTVESLVTAYRRRVIELTVAAPGAEQCLRRLRSAGHRLAIVTNGSSLQQHAKVDRLGLRELVDAVVVSGDVGIAKPDIRVFRAAAAAVGSSLAGAWMVGDSPTHDIVGGAACGAETVWLSRGRTWTESAAMPTITISSLAELVPEMLDGRTP